MKFLKKNFTGKLLHLIRELIAETEAYFGNLPIEYFSDCNKFENRCTRFIYLKGEYVDN